MKAVILETKIEKIVDMGVQQTRHFKLAFGSPDLFDFEAGQFVSVILKGENDKNIKRAYSIASPPCWKGFIDLCWKKVDGGFATGELWELGEGDTLEIQGPLGHFTAKQPLPKDIIFISTGTGIAPFRSIMYQLLHEKADCQIWNLFGNRYETDILYQEEFETLEKENSNFHNLLTVSRPEKWTGEKAYVQEVLKKHFKDASDKHIYICGLSSMIEAVVAAAHEIGFTDEQIFFEKYD